ncbi:MAG: GIY-YIG nuclease family protein [bacterium]|nr:GIY-YIG nuclease family protein [bacterium]
MHYLYVLKSVSRGRHYIGITGNIKKRLADHNGKAVRSTKAYTPWRLIGTEEFPDKTSARKRELFLKKTAKAREVLFATFDSAPIV